MPEAKDSEDKIVVTESETAGDEVQKPEGLSLRDALEVALEGSKDADAGTGDRTNKRDRGLDADQSKSVAADKVSKVDEKSRSEIPHEPPAEYNAQEKEDFRQLSRKGQEAQLRLDDSRRRKHDEIKQATAEQRKLAEEYGWSKELVKQVTPYLKANNGKKTTEQALIDALKMWNEFEYGDPKKASADYLRAKGQSVPKELLAEQSVEVRGLEEKIAPLRKELDEIKSRQAQEDHARVTQTLTTAYDSFEKIKNAAGSSKYPDLGNPELGPRIAGSIGSLAGGKTELSREFIAKAKALDPNLTYDKLFERAYVFSGGTIDNSAEAPRTQETQKLHIVKSNRAASSVPGRAASASSTSGPVKKFKTYREAAEHAMAYHKEIEGD